MLATRCLVLILSIALSCLAQQRYTNEFGGMLRGFSRTSCPDQIHISEKPTELQSVRGLVVHGAYKQPVPITDVTFEIRGPGNSPKIRGTKSDKNGRFKLGHVPQGKYVYMATICGFRSMVGTLVVSKDADRKKEIKIEATYSPS